MPTTILRSGREDGGFKGTCVGEVKAGDQRLTKQAAQRGPFLGISCTGGEGKALTSDGFSGTRTWDEGLSLVRKNDTQAEIKKQG